MKAYIRNRCIAPLILKLLPLKANPVIFNMLLILKLPYYLISLLNMP